MQRFHRLAITPFETVFGVLAIISGIAGLLHAGPIDPLTAVLPGWLAMSFQVLYLVSGLFILAGLFIASFPTEGAGLVFLATTAVVREIVFVEFLGFHSAALVSATFYAGLLWGCAARFLTLVRGEVLVRTKGVVEE